ncbi:MAG: protein-L-isoaspartate(D-aspartate) O-methyltransferase [Rubrivivax sp.]|nr:protein-L-isoaspartate(D-aspartate) O-methyltransferase [Rubrivivax sp.]
MAASGSGGGGGGATGGRRRFPLPLARVRGEAPQAPGPGPGALQRPQRLVRQAAQAEAARGAAPAGLGLDSTSVRMRMVRRLRDGGIDDERVLAAFAQVPRHRFVDSALANQAYEDTSLPIGHGQTISKPSVVAHMLQELLRDRVPAGGRAAVLGRVLEVGAGCGYQAALLACLAEQVVSIERLGPLAAKAQAHLNDLGLGERVIVLHGDGRAGAPAHAPFDGIVSAAGGDDVPAAWQEQLAPAGRLVAPCGVQRPGVQPLVVIDCSARGFERRMAGEVFFVPLKSGVE